MGCGYGERLVSGRFEAQRAFEELAGDLKPDF